MKYLKISLVLVFLSIFSIIPESHSQEVQGQAIRAFDKLTDLRDWEIEHKISKQILPEVVKKNPPLEVYAGKITFREFFITVQKNTRAVYIHIGDESTLWMQFEFRDRSYFQLIMRDVGSEYINDLTAKDITFAEIRASAIASLTDEGMLKVSSFEPAESIQLIKLTKASQVSTLRKALDSHRLILTKPVQIGRFNWENKFAAGLGVPEEKFKEGVYFWRYQADVGKD